MEKLILPLNCVIEGDISSIAHEGDIQIDNGILPPSLFSGEGNISLSQIEPDSKCDSISAKVGDIGLKGGSLNAQSILCKSFSAQLEHLEAQSIQVTQGKTSFTGDVLKVEQLNGETIEIEAKTVRISRLFAGGDVTIRAEKVHVDELVGEKVSVSGNLECNKVTASDGLFMESGRVAIKNLDAPTFQSEEGVGGIVMVATCEDVQTKGVRGFLLPSELGLFSKGNTTMDLSEILTDKEPSSKEPTTVSVPTQENPVSPALRNDPSPNNAPDDEDQPEVESWPDGENEEKAFESTPSEPLDEYATDETDLDTSQSLEAGEAPDDEDEELDTGDHGVSDDVLYADEAENDSSPFFRTTTVVGESAQENDLGEMKTVQLDPSQLANAIKARDIAAEFQNQVAGDALDDDSLVEVSSEEVEEVDLDSQELVPELASLPEIEDFDDYHNTADLGEDSDEPILADEDPLQELAMPGENEGVWEAESGEIEVEELSEEDFYAVEDGDLTDAGVQDSQPGPDVNPEARLRQSLTEVLNQIRACFPDENYPKFIYQIQNYVNEGRYSILAKSRNKEAVLSSFEKLNHPEISKLSGRFYSTLDDFFQDGGLDD